MSLVIRPENDNDADDIHRITIAAFKQAEHSDHNEQQIIANLRASSALSISLVAVENSTPLAHIAFSPVQISDGTEHWFGLGPLSVLPERQKQGIGSSLVRQGLAQLRTIGAKGCVVLGDPHYYGRFGFHAHPKLGFKGVPPEYFQALSFSQDLPSGWVQYHSSFYA